MNGMIWIGSVCLCSWLLLNWPAILSYFFGTPDFETIRADLPIFTLEELRKFNGDDGVAYIAVNGTVFDVSSSNSYKQFGSYHRLAGRDASVALAKMDMSETSLSQRVEEANLTESEYKSLEGWARFYRKKRYPPVGRLV